MRDAGSLYMRQDPHVRAVGSDCGNVGGVTVGGIAIHRKEDVIALRGPVVLQGHLERVGNDHPQVTAVHVDREYPRRVSSFFARTKLTVLPSGETEGPCRRHSRTGSSSGGAR